LSVHILNYDIGNVDIVSWDIQNLLIVYQTFVELKKMPNLADGQKQTIAECLRDGVAMRTIVHVLYT
jgi:hypothetical protein